MYGRVSTFRHGLDELGSTPQPAESAHSPIYEVDDFLLRHLASGPQFDEGSRDLACGLIGNSDDGGVSDSGMRNKDILQLGRCHLMPLVLDELFEAVDDAEMAEVVDVADVTSVKPSFRIDHISRSLRIVEIALGRAEGHF